ncbi:hypothetical protein PVK06_035100 [Gossypium arboreum]|uniref:Uncharacterized protein n=1 Tax=Gossypium arboreum TaxID=29729 RepID=A0ABR0NGW9_GOSAR|nr:hypothetical protein PVK06_035100 [Gossypium arboreum]
MQEMSVDEKETKEKEESEQEKARRIFTNHPVSSPCKVSSFQVSRNSIDKFQLHYLPDKRVFRFIKKGKNKNDPSPPAIKGKHGKGLMIEPQQFSVHINEWYPLKEGGYGNNLLPLQTICGSQDLGNDFVRFMNKGICDLERFFVSKWPDLRTNHLQKGGYDANPVVSCYDPTFRH